MADDGGETKDGGGELPAADVETREETTARVVDLAADDVLEATSSSSSDSSSSGEENASVSQDMSEGESSDTDLEGRGKWIVQGAKEAKDEEGFELVVRRASRRLAKKERQRELKRERAEKGAQAK